MGYSLNEEDERRISRCARSAATVFAEIAFAIHTDANAVCAVCGLTMVDPSFVGSDYFDVIMRVGRHVPGTRLRRVR